MVNDCLDRFHDFHEAIKFDLEFGPDMEHYLAEPGYEERALHRMKPRDPGLFRVWRYKLGLMLKRFPINVETRPLTQDTNPEDVENARRAVERQVLDRKFNYLSVRRRLAGGALAARAWGVSLSYNPRVGLVVRSEQPDRIGWCEGFLDLHDPECPWAYRLRRMRVSEAKATFKKAARDLKGDAGPTGEIGPRGSSQGGLQPTAAPDDRRGDDEFVTVVYFYSRFEKKSAKKPADPLVPIEPEMRHLACAQCGWTSPPQAEAMVDYPPAAQCPQCGDIAHRVDAIARLVDDNAYTNGKRLVICAPWAQQASDAPWYDGDWEFDYDFFPVDLLIAYVPPHKTIGQSDTSILKTPLLGKNAMMRLAYETLLTSKPKWLMPPNGAVQNVYGQPFMFQPGDGDIMLYGGSPGDVEVKQGHGVNNDVFLLMREFDAVFRVNESTSEVALSPSQLSEAKVGTVEQYTETGNVVLDDHGALLYELESRQFTNIACALRELPSRTVRYRAMDGSWQFKQIGGPLMPAVEVEVGAGHTLEELDRDEIESYMALVQMPPEARIGFAMLKHIDPSVLRMLPVVRQPDDGTGDPEQPPPMPPVEAQMGAPNG